MLGYRLGLIHRMACVNHSWRRVAIRRFLRLTALLGTASPLCPLLATAQQIHPPPGKGQVAELEAKAQTTKGDLTTADGDVEIRYADTRLRADHVEYDSKTYEATATGHVQLDYGNEHLEADEAHYNVSTGHGLFQNVHGTFKIERQPNDQVLLTDNPLYFEARTVERFAGDLYFVQRAWITICDPGRPKWQFYAPEARIRLDKTVALDNANFRLFRVPLIWLPLDTTFGAQYMSRRGVLERGNFRARPFENTSVEYTYFGVDDRGLLTDGTRSPQGGQQQRLEIQSLLPHGWRFVTDYNHLSSLTFRLAFADTFGDAINAEVQSALFLTNNFRGFSLNLAGINDKSFLTLPVEATPATTVTLRNLPQARFGSVEQAPWHKIPLYFSLDSFVGAVHRADSVPPTPSYTPIDTPLSVPREEFAPRVTLPVHFGPWFGATASAAFRATRYGDSLNAAGVVSGTAIVRNTGEFAVELRPPSFERFFGTKKNKLQRRYKHSIEPAITYRYVTGVNNFADFIRFDSDATLTDTSEVEYGFTQRLYRKDGGDQPQELISWRIAQKHYFDPTFGGAMVNGQRNVFQALDSISPFAFAFGPRNWSPIISDFKLTPGGPYDLEQILQYDPEIQRLATIGTLVKAKPYREFFATIAYFRLNENPSPGDIASLPPPQVCVPANEPCPFQQPLSNQIRALVGYGSENRKGFNFTGGVGYDFTKQTLQNQIVQASYNGSCCGLALEYRRLNLSTVRTENQFRVAFILANIGTFGNLRHRDKIF
ncbi:MAG: hypothetical protein DMG42_10505 [Acidobacteria bacterium]|nr:MAG: hypothetical protein DMG42_10505 [Acidobacteriota bacterium]